MTELYFYLVKCSKTIEHTYQGHYMLQVQRQVIYPSNEKIIALLCYIPYFENCSMFTENFPTIFYASKCVIYRMIHSSILTIIKMVDLYHDRNQVHEMTKPF